MAVGNRHVARDLGLTQVISAAGRLSSFDAVAVDQLVSAIDRMHAELTADTFAVAPDVLTALAFATRTLTDVHDVLEHRMSPSSRTPELLAAVMEAFDRVGVDRLCPEVLRSVLAQLEPVLVASVQVLIRRLVAYGVRVHSSRTGAKYYRLTDIQLVAGVPQALRQRPRLLAEIDEICRRSRLVAVRRRHLKLELTAERSVFAVISDADFGTILKMYGVTSYWRGGRCRILTLQVRRALSRYNDVVQ